jgi:hypothetical protein
LQDARKVLLPSPYRDERDLVMVSARGGAAETPRAVSLEKFRRMERQARWFNGLAFYQPMPAHLNSGGRRFALTVARASDNLFDLLGIPVQRNPGKATLVLSEQAWRKHFGGDPRQAGRTVEVAGQSAVVVGVIPADSWRLPGKVDAWLLEDDARLGSAPLPSGFVVAHVRDSERRQGSTRWNIWVANDHGESDGYECRPLNDGGPMVAVLAMILISCLVLPATTRLGLGEYPANRHRLAWNVRLRRWMFLGAKVALMIPIVFCGSLDLGAASHESFHAQGLIWGCLLGFRWILTDQRRRCPVCLRVLTNPVRIGRPSQTFLEWYGTELMCTQGHGLLHVPEVTGSYRGGQRWLYLDGSWKGLFTPAPGMRH